MALFQKTVEQKYLKQLDSALINAKYLEFKTHFGNTIIQENIRNSKEEQYQGEFLIDLFVKILGYVKNPTPNFNLTTEYKNIKDSKKADGAIIINDSVKAVIELKGTNTTDLGKIETQAFGYKNNQSGCVYVVTSNFEKLRFYIDNAIEYIEFNLFQLSKADFEILYLCLSFESIKNGLPKKVKDESLSQEDIITKKLYQDYSLFKRELHQNLVSLNPQFDSLTLFKKSQKLLDRFLFLFFAEDRHLLPPNSVRLILNDWRDLQERDVEIPLYQRFKKYFEYLNTGYKGKRYDVFAYNGGLFKPDVVLDNILIDDELLFRHTYNLSEYDFASEIDVNILGHIFENSLNELDEINAQLAGQEIDKTKTKRKKDGVFYTPKYITKYIVENTVGKLCEEKKQQIGIVNEISFERKKNGKLTQKAKDYFALLESYRAWLKQITIIDPACGSGAFLNQSLEFLLNEHGFISNQLQNITGDLSTMFVDIEKSILENNLFGVDLNEESVEIAKLSLWLRTAQPNRKLNDLSNNIKCGNSLIDDPAVAGDKAFNWHKAFPQVFEKGGFDVVIGNPPYVNSKGENIDENIKKYLTKSYSTAAYQIDLYILFLERALFLINKVGYVSFIVPNTWLNNLMLEPIRKYMLENARFEEFISMPSNTFEEANVDTVITSYRKGEKNENVRIIRFFEYQFIHVDFANQLDWISSQGASINIYLTKEVSGLIQKIEQNSILLGNFSNIIRGVGVYHKRVGHTKEFIELDPYQSSTKKDDSFIPYLRGRNLNKWLIDWNNDSYISYGNWLAEPRKSEYFIGERILVRKILAKGLVATYIEKEFVVDQQLYTIIINKSCGYTVLGILPIICSKLMSFYFRFKYSEFDDLFPQIKLNHVKSLPIKIFVKEDQQPFTEKANQMLSLNKELHETSQKFQRNIQREYNLEKLSAKLENWVQTPFSEFLKELEKNKVKLTLSQKAEWEDYFIQESKKALEIKHQIDSTDKEIDRMVYQLYELTDEEIAIVENPQS